MQKFYTTAQVAEIMSSNRQYVSNLRRTGLLKGIKAGNRYLFLESEIDRFAKAYEGYDLSNPVKMLQAKAEVDG